MPSTMSSPKNKYGDTRKLVEKLQDMGCPELTTVFCNTDDCCYGNMHPKLQ